MAQVIDREEAAVESASVLVARTNFRVPSDQARDWVFETLESEIQSSTGPNILKALFRPTSIPTILELELHINSTTFAGAERIAETFLSSIHELLTEKFPVTEMSTGIRPA